MRRDHNYDVKAFAECEQNKSGWSRSNRTCAVSRNQRFVAIALVSSLAGTVPLAHAQFNDGGGAATANGAVAIGVAPPASRPTPARLTRSRSGRVRSRTTPKIRLLAPTRKPVPPARTFATRRSAVTRRLPADSPQR